VEQAVEVRSEITGTVWKLLLAPGQRVGEGDAIAILESMKMEIPVESPASGCIQSLMISEGQAIAEGALIALIERD
jgi:acetyl-CoA carboxylase biotin carboxyl carrier protein